MKTILSFCFLALSVTAFSQSDKYVSAMKKNIGMIDSAIARNNTAELANTFQRIGDAEKNQWLPYYYAAYMTAFQALTTQDASKKDEIADKAQGLLDKAQDILGKENSEIYVIKSMIATAHMTVDPQGRYMTYGPAISEAIKKAETLDPTNPRPVLLEAQNLFYTPEAFGGGKAAAKPLFEKAQGLFDNFKPETDLSPNWGRSNITYFMQNYK